MKLTKIAMSGLFCLAIVPIFSVAISPVWGTALTFGDSGWTMLIGMGVMLLGTGAVVGMHMARSKREFRFAEPESPSEKISHHLVALSSAAILAVYSAGYFHTRSAANRFIEEAVEERAVASATNFPATSEGQSPDATPPGRYGLGTPAPPDTESGPTSHSGSTRSSSGSSPATGAQSGAQSTDSADAGNDAAPNPSSPTPATSERGSESGQADGQAGANGPDRSDRAGGGAGFGESLAPSTQTKVRYKDGTYLGWGTCRHGDIQASVVIQGGKIASADIAKCYTRYPCDVIGQLPGQVVSRQSVAVDYVSGATQSVYAFQQAVAAALAMAKGK